MRSWPSRQRSANSADFDGAYDHGFVHYLAGIPGIRTRGVLVHQPGQQILVERAPVYSDSHRLLVLSSDLDHRLKILVVMAARSDVPGVDSILRKCLRAIRVLLEQDMPVVVEVPDYRDTNSLLAEPLDDMRHGLRGLTGIDRDANQLGAGTREIGDLFGCGFYIDGVGIGHRLDDDRVASADAHAVHVYGDRLSSLDGQGLLLKNRAESGADRMAGI
jgi:hypothetical protein